MIRISEEIPLKQKYCIIFGAVTQVEHLYICDHIIGLTKGVFIMPLPKERIYTIDDIYALPDGERAELIDDRSI